MPNTNLLKEFLSRLLSKDLSDDDVFILSSAQRARVIAWAQTNAFPILDKELRGNLTINIIASGSVGETRFSSPLALSPKITEQNIEPAFGVGLDIQLISELFPEGLPEDPKNSEELSKIFSLSELSYAQSSLKPMETLAGLFAAKEAVVKAGSSRGLRDIEILPNSNGTPTTAGYSISISHSGDFAVAVALPNLVVGSVGSGSDVDPKDVSASQVGKSQIGWSRKAFDLFLLIGLGALFTIVLLRS